MERREQSFTSCGEAGEENYDRRRGGLLGREQEGGGKRADLEITSELVEQKKKKRKPAFTKLAGERKGLLARLLSEGGGKKKRRKKRTKSNTRIIAASAHRKNRREEEGKAECATLLSTTSVKKGRYLSHNGEKEGERKKNTAASMSGHDRKGRETKKRKKTPP